MDGDDPRIAGRRECVDAPRGAIDVRYNDFGRHTDALLQKIGDKAGVVLIHRGDEPAGIGVSGHTHRG